MIPIEPTTILIINLLFLMPATYRLYFLLAQDAGPFDVFQKFRDLIGVEENGDNFTSKLFGCVFCLSLWTGGFLSLASVTYVGSILIVPLGASAGAILLDKIIHYLEEQT